MPNRPKVACEYPPAALAWTVWGLGATFYLLGFFHRVTPAVLSDDLSLSFGLSAASLGSLSAFYFYSYVAMQIPTGLLADYFGPRRVLVAGAALAALGSALFAFAETFAWASIGRLMIGGSVAVAFVSLLKLAGHWLYPRQYALASGLALFAGAVGAVAAGVPLEILSGKFGWRTVMAASGLIALVISFGVWWLVRDDPSERGFRSHVAELPDQKMTLIGILRGLKEIFTYRNTWLLALVPGGIVGAILTFSGLWGVPFLKTVYGLDVKIAATLCSALMVAWAVGGPVFGMLSDRIGRRKPLYVLGCTVALACWSVLFLRPGLSEFSIVALMLLAGFFSGCMVLGFVFIKESLPLRLSGTASGLINMGVMCGPMLLQPAVGRLLDRHWNGLVSEGERIYSFSAYRWGFALILAWLCLSVVLVSLTRETHCRQTA